MESENRVSEAISRCRTFKRKIGPFQINLNPVVSIISAVIIWGLMIWSIVDTERASREMGKGKAWISETFTWFYIITQDAWFLFLIIVYFSKYSNMKLGRDDEEPEFSDVSYFTMLFSAGIGIGLFYYGVAEPLFHYHPGEEYGNRFWNRYTDNQRAQDAINITFFHWGIHGWIVYTLVGLLMAFIAYRKGLPMTIRSCFYPLLGDRIFGVVGDIIDIISVVPTMFGIATSLGIGVLTLNSGLNRMHSGVEETTNNQIIIIWAVTCLATISVVSGLKVGIRRLSEVCFGLGIFLMLFVFFHDNTWFFLNLYVQSIGYYFQYLVQYAFHTDAFAQLANAPDGKQAPNWMADWTVFSWGWWITWSPFVGMFIAKISRGGTVRNFINATLTAPILYIFIWFTIFGGAGLKMERDAAIAGINCSSELGGTNATEPLNRLFRLSCRTESQMYFDVIQQYGNNLGGFLKVVSLISAVLYFVTSSDSGSLVIDCLTANGNPNPPVIQRVFWAFTEGACTTTLLKAGGTKAIDALQSFAIALGLLYAVILNLMCLSLWRTMQMEAGDYDHHRNTFSSSLISVFDKPSWRRVLDILIWIVAPWWPAGRAAGMLYMKSPVRYMVVMASLFYGWVLLEILQVVEPGLAYVGWVVLIFFFVYLASIRLAIREHFEIKSSTIEDAILVSVFYPLAVDQMYRHMLIEGKSKKDDPGTGSVDLPEVFINEKNDECQQKLETV
ncbi:uncharacterized protein LOC114524858 [Dendronephthya gigantea]|uniref:uncharacterized protein LOC114524858 n=1 Tax=Dendronephthya gigantea TaxID=151771 RepID=UPI0010691AD7|nr:uncharacterized protein LOC114524858 [Dendronephthya gigantea]